LGSSIFVCPMYNDPKSYEMESSLLELFPCSSRFRSSNLPSTKLQASLESLYVIELCSLQMWMKDRVWNQGIFQCLCFVDNIGESEMHVLGLVIYPITYQFGIRVYHQIKHLEIIIMDNVDSLMLPPRTMLKYNQFLEQS